MDKNLGSVMLVDDDADQRTTLQMLLSGYDMEVMEAGTGEEALEKLAQHPPNLILLDFDMPGINGLQTLDKIREQFTQEQLPVVMVSNRQDSDIIIQALDNGANDYVTKVTDPDVMLARIRRHLIQRRLPNPKDRPFGGRLGPYLLGDKVSEGPISSLYQATDTRDDRPRALRILKPGIRVNKEKFDSLASCHHELLADLLDVGVDPVDFLVFELVEGSSLDKFLGGRELSKAEVAEFALRIAQVVEVIHAQGRRHGELRPSNVKINTQNVPVVLDFGLAELLRRENAVTRSHDIAGHPSYLAPEQLQNPTSVDARSDLYAVGALLYTLATGRHPFDGTMADVLHSVLHDKPERPSSLRQDGERAFDFVCLKLLNKDPDSRYSSIAEVRQKLSELAEEAKET